MYLYKAVLKDKDLGSIQLQDLPGKTFIIVSGYCDSRLDIYFLCSEKKSWFKYQYQNKWQCVYLSQETTLDKNINIKPRDILLTKELFHFYERYNKKACIIVKHFDNYYPIHNKEINKIKELYNDYIRNCSF